MKPWRRRMLLELAHDRRPLTGYCSHAEVTTLTGLVKQTSTPGTYQLTGAGKMELARLRAVLAIADEVEAICKET
jgi:aerobic-type carbon monoxide dehydrogenase small subunit (CoxS/CutS family)